MSAPPVWFVLPSRREGQDSTLWSWRERGYRIAVCREPELPQTWADLVVPTAKYLGWPRSVNLLVHRVLAEYPETRWFVCGGDDTLPDPNHAPDEIAEQCSKQCLINSFLRRQDARTPAHLRIDQDKVWKLSTEKLDKVPESTFGVCQPTGDPWSDSQGRIIERIAGSPWIGREFARRMYHGAGPLYPGFYHNFADEHLQLVAQKLGCFWQRPELIHEHKHWARPRADRADQPAWAGHLYDGVDWKHGQALFQRLKAGGFAEANHILEA